MTTCFIHGCCRPIHSNGLCNTHYSRLYRAGVDLPTIGAPLDVLRLLLADALICLRRACVQADKLHWRKRVVSLRQQIDTMQRIMEVGR